MNNTDSGNNSKFTPENILIGLFLITLGVFIFIVCLPVWHETSIIYRFSNIIFGVFGRGVVAVAIALVGYGTASLFSFTSKLSAKTKAYSVLAIFFFVCALHVVTCKEFLTETVDVTVKDYINYGYNQGVNTAGGAFMSILTCLTAVLISRNISVILFFALSGLFVILILWNNFPSVFGNTHAENRSDKQKNKNDNAVECETASSSEQNENGELDQSFLNKFDHLSNGKSNEIVYKNPPLPKSYSDRENSREFAYTNGYYDADKEETPHSYIPEDKFGEEFGQKIDKKTNNYASDPTYVNAPINRTEREVFSSPEQENVRDGRDIFKIFGGLEKKKQSTENAKDNKPATAGVFSREPESEQNKPDIEVFRTKQRPATDGRGEFATDLIAAKKDGDESKDIIDRYRPFSEKQKQNQFYFPNSEPIAPRTGYAERSYSQDNTGTVERTSPRFYEPPTSTYSGRREDRSDNQTINSFVPDMSKAESLSEEAIRSAARMPKPVRREAPEPQTFQPQPQPVQQYVQPKAVAPVTDDNDSEAFDDLFSDDSGVYHYNRPPLTNFEKGKDFELTDAIKNKLQKDSEIIVSTLAQFRVKATVEEVQPGTSVIRYKIKLGEGINISSLKKYVDNLTAALRAPSSVAIEQIFGTDLIAIEVALTTPQKVTFRDIVESDEFEYGNGLQIAYGKTIDGKKFTLNLQEMPHLLVAGQTGSGKSVFLNSLICGLISKYSPAELKLILFDPKRVEMQAYSNLPHMLFPEALKDAGKMVNVFKFLVKKMEDRYKLFNKVSTDTNLIKNIDEYNAAYPAQKIPKFVLIIDEYAQICAEKQYVRDIEDCIKQLAQLARAAGIHIVLATQRPSVDIITGVIKVNFPIRISFKVSSYQDSKTIIERGGAEKLIGKGDSYFVNGEKYSRVQACFISNSEIMELVNYVKHNNPPAVYDERIQKILDVVEQEEPQPVQTPVTQAQPKRVVETSVEFNQRMQDEFCHDPNAYKILSTIVMTQRATVTSLSNMCAIGYPKASRFMATMEKMGVVSAQDPINNQRTVLIQDMDELNEKCVNWGVEMPEE